MGFSGRGSLLSALGLALAGGAAFALFVSGGDPSDAPVASRSTAAAPSPSRPDDADPARGPELGPAGGGRSAEDPRGAVSLGPGAGGAQAPEDWRTSPRLWLFTAEDRDRVTSLLEGYAAAVRDSNWKEIERLSKEIKALGARAVAPLLDVLLRDPDDRTRIYAAALLGDMQESVPGGILREALRAHALPLLEEVASTAEDASLRHSALVALGKIRDPESLDFLVDTVRRAEGWPWVTDAIGALGALRGEGVTAQITDLAESESDPRVRERLARALGDREDPSSLGVLQDLARRDIDPAVRAAAAEALGGLGIPRAAAELRDIAGGQDNPAVRAAALWALREFPESRDIQFLRGVLGSGDDAEVRTAAWRSLRKMNTPVTRQAIATYRPAVRVDDVLPGTQAERLRLSANDVITSYNGKPVGTAGGLRDLVLSTPPERVVPLVVDHGGWTTTVFVHGGLLGIRVQDGVVLD